MCLSPTAQDRNLLSLDQASSKICDRRNQKETSKEAKENVVGHDRASGETAKEKGEDKVPAKIASRNLHGLIRRKWLNQFPPSCNPLACLVNSKHMPEPQFLRSDWNRDKSNCPDKSQDLTDQTGDENIGHDRI